MKTEGCPGCSCKVAQIPSDVTIKNRAVVECTRCGAIYTRWTLGLGESYGIVLPWFDADPSLEGTKYFDFICLGSEGVQRRHGWYRPATKCIVQVG